MKRKICIAAGATTVLLLNNTIAQDRTANKFGKGIQIVAADSSFSMKFGTRIQNLFIAEASLNDSVKWDDVATSAMVRRARLKFDGFAYSQKVQYKIELGLTNSDIGNPVPEGSNASNIILDAIVDWNFYQNFSLVAGQTKLPGNRERVISSQALQFVDRSLLNSQFNIDRDMGLQLKHHFHIGKMVVREALCATQGEGRDITKGNVGGYDYTGRLELLPFGEFAGKGDYFSADLKREETPKLALGITYDNNDRASKQKGQLGSILPDKRTLKTLFADMMFKYTGFSILAEYAQKQAEHTPVVSVDKITGKPTKSFYTGTGYNFQAGYLFKNHWELAGRYTYIEPEKITGNKKETQYTVGLSKYIVGHNLKFQSDASLLQMEGINDPELMVRMQVELAF